MALSNYNMKARYTRNLIQRGVKVRNAVLRRGFHDYTTSYKCNYTYRKAPSECNHRAKGKVPAAKPFLSNETGYKKTAR